MRKIVIDVLRWIYWGPTKRVLTCFRPAYLFQIQKIISFFVYHIFKDRKIYIAGELKRCFGSEWPEVKIKSSVRDGFNVYVGSQLSMLSLNKLNSLNIDKYIWIEGLDNLVTELERKRGVIILNPHFGPFMMIMPALGYRGFKATQIAVQGEPPTGRKGIAKKVYDIKFKSIEKNMPVNFINVAFSAFSLREAIKSLKNNEIVLYPSTGRGGIAFHAVNLMRSKALLSLTPFNMALKTGAALLPAFVTCEVKGTKVILEKSIPVENGSTAEGLVEKYAEVLDSYIERYPDHFLMFLYDTHKAIGATPFFKE